MRRVSLLILAILAVTLRARLDACSVCFSGEESTRYAFYWTTVLMTGMPFAVFGSLYCWFRKRAKKLRKK